MKIFVEGNIGAGKTEFLARSRDFETFRGFGKVLWLTEPVEVWKDLHGSNILELFYQDQKRLAFQMQSLVQLTLLKQNVKQEREKAEISIQERSIFSSYYVFKRELEEQGLLTDTEAKILNEWFRYMTGGELGEFGADLIIYLRTDPKVALDRVRTRDRKEERNITLEKMENLHKYYEDWLLGQVNKKNPNKLWIVDANKPQREMEVEFRQMWKLIERKLKDMESGGV